MTNKINHLSDQFARVAGLMLLALFILQSSPLKANDYLEQEKHYQIYANGVNKVHFVIPVWAYGKGYDYYAYDESYVSYTVNGGSETVIANYKTDKYDENENKDSKKGTAYVYLHNGQGDIVVTSMYNGVNYQVPSGSWTGKMYVTQKDHDDCPQVTMLEFDWHIPASLEKSTFSVKIVSKFRRSYTDGNAMTTTATQTDIQGTETTITPQLYTPYLYTLNEKGVAGYGYAAVPYMVFQEPKKYYTSFEPGTIVDKDINRSGTLYVPTNDTVQEQLSATFTVVRDAKTGSTIDIKSTAQDIPPYHRIYNFGATVEKDNTGTFTGNNILRWSIKNPMLKDLMDNDYFEVQRALESNFSDAERVSIVLMVRDTIGQYTLIDNSRDTWTGNATSKLSYEERYVTVNDQHYLLYDSNNEPLAELSAKLVSNTIQIPSVPVYYRIRRASSSMWDWDNEFVQKATLYNMNYLAPLAATQESYTKDADYENNHKVNFRIKIDNIPPHSVIIDKDECTLSCFVNKVLREQMVNVNISYNYIEPDINRVNPSSTVSFRVVKSDGTVFMDWGRLAAGTHQFPINSTIIMKCDHGYCYNSGEEIRRALTSSCSIECYTERYMKGASLFDINFTATSSGTITSSTNSNSDYVDVYVKYVTDGPVSSPEGTTVFDVIYDNTNYAQGRYLMSGWYQYPKNSRMNIYNNDSETYEWRYYNSFILSESCEITIYAFPQGGKRAMDAIMTPASSSQVDDDISAEIRSLLNTVKDSLVKLMPATVSLEDYGKSMWDRTANLVLQRTIEETGQTMEFIIPQDSIRRQADGSWLATYSDIADQGCSHYKYAVRIDQSRSDLHVQDSASLKPIQITGPSLYFDEAATITRFEASQGDATTAMKPGVLLRWEASSNAVDEFVLLRKETGSDATPDTVYSGTNYDYFDRSAVPNQHYEYTIAANYTCNGRTTTNSASATGWRSPYGEISGTVHQSDNSGMAGVTVALQDGEGNIVRTMQTDACGAYKFDSVEYELTKTYVYEDIEHLDSIMQCEDPTVNITYGDQSNSFTKCVFTRILNPDGVVLQDWTAHMEGTHTYPYGSFIEAKLDISALGTLPSWAYSYYPNSGQVFSFTLDKHITLLYAMNTNHYFDPVIAASSDRCKYLVSSEIEHALVDSVITVTHATNYSVVPTHQYGVFSFNNTSAGTASITLSTDNAVAQGIDFVNTSSTRLTGRVLYKNSTIPVAGAMFLLNGDTVRRGNDPLTSGIDGNFELLVTKGQPCRLQVFKTGHQFEGEGILHVEEGTDTFALTKPLDAVRFYDETKVRLVGRVAGGNDQRDLPHGFGLGKNNLGDNLQLVLQLEGDNTAHFVHDPNDLTRDTIQQTTAHIIYSTDSLAAEKERSVGTTHTLFEKKRIIIHPDLVTGEFAVDLFPVKYKVVQATANGYATLFANGQGSETFDLTNAPLQEYVSTYDAETRKLTETYVQGYSKGIARVYDLPRSTSLYAGDSIAYNAVYDRIYHSPVEVSLTQVLYGLEKDGFGEEEMEVSSMNLTHKPKVKLYTKAQGEPAEYLLGHPVFIANRKYQFVARAYERYYYNNDAQAGALDEVPQRGGKVRVHNGLKSATTYQDYALDSKGENHTVALEVTDIDTESSGDNALRTVSTALEVEDNWVETEVFQAFVSGTDIQQGELMQTPSAVVLLDVVRDPGGAGSSAWVESGTTYNFSYTESYDWEIGVELTPTWGVNISQDIGAVAAPEGAGSYIGSTYTSERQLSFTLPITHEWKWGYKYNYQFTTNDRITTSSSHAKAGVGSNADVFIGTTVSQLAGKAKTVSIISDSMYIARQPAIQAGVMKVLGNGTAADGKQYHLVTGQQIVLGSEIGNTFVYTQSYVLNTLIPKLALERMNLLMNFPDSLSAQQYADNNGMVVYWNKGASAAANTSDMESGTYRMIKPAGKDHLETDRIAALNNVIADWVKIVYFNEKEKVMARMGGKPVGTWSVSAGTTFTHTDSYTATLGYNEMPQSGELFGFETANNASKTGQKLLADMQGIIGFFKDMGDNNIGTSVAAALTKVADENNVDPTNKADQQTLGTTTNTTKFKLNYNPVFEFDSNANSSTEKTIKKSAGFTLGADAQGDITVAVYRADLDSVWERSSDTIRSGLVVQPDEDYRYGSYVFYTVAGSSYCPHEAEEKTQFYNKGTTLNNETQWIHKPELSIDTYEQTAVLADKRATFRVTMMDAGQVQTGAALDGTGFELSLIGSSNPDGAKLYMDGAPLITSVPVWLSPGQAVTKVLEVERGLVDDYDSLALILTLADCGKTYTSLKFSVHFLPVSSDVAISMPRQNWIMNTLSQHDSAGYYLPVEIDGFNIHHKNFDHIEFQYKLSTESEEMWVNQCSFYADDSLYNLATGNKAMIRNGRIEPFRFYGERDPMEQKYDLRAVSFCRYGSGFVTKSSPVISGTKDTRPPRVFGYPEPANSILGVGDNLKLRFNEPIAGNYLDEDNNFQIKGVTNATGITTKASVHFDGTQESYAATQVSRNLEGRSVTIDMLVKPTAPNAEAVFFSHGEGEQQVRFGKTADNRLYISNSEGAIYSKQAEQMLDFTRVIATYDASSNTIHFYAGTQDLTDGTGALPQDLASYYKTSAPLVFGRGLDGNMLEVRLWTKALTQEEIAATHLRYLTGYEQELVAYYQMAEGQGTTLADRAGGATLLMHGASWNLPKGISLKIASGEQVQLNDNLLGRSKVYDETLMLWFRATNNSGDIFKAGWIAGADSIADKGTLLTLVDGNLVLHSDEMITSVGRISDNDWHHFVLTVNRTYNNVSAFVDGKMTATFAATELAGISGAMYLGGNGFEGNIDEFVLFEQALPKTLVAEYGNHSPAGDEMGLMAYLPFEEQILNANGILELVFSVNDQREFKDANGNVVEKTVPLINEQIANEQIDKSDYAPVTGGTLLSKLNFDWAFNQDELLINLKNADKEINKQTVFVTVRDVEDLNGNPMPSPVMWVAYVDRNSVTWDNNKMEIWTDYGDEYAANYNYRDMRIVNNSGRRHQFTIESLPDWLTVNQSFGSIQPIDDFTVRFTYDTTLPVGEYSDLVYVTDENGLSEPLKVIYHVVATCPYEDVDKTKYPLNMSLCGQVKIGDEYDTNSNDKVIALYRNECVGMANVSFDNQTNRSDVYLTIYGNEQMNRKAINFVLWQASTGKVYDLTTTTNVLFSHGFVYGCGEPEPLLLTTAGSEMQNIALSSGWNWVSVGLDMSATEGVLASCVTANTAWTDGDIIKNTNTRQFSTYDASTDAFSGTLTALHYSQMYMIYVAESNTMRVSGETLPGDSMVITVRGDGQWSPMPCLLQESTPVTEALADYYDNAAVGDMVKSHNAFAFFSQNKKWEGNLTAIRPGEGYLFRRMNPGKKDIHFYNKTQARAAKKSPRHSGIPASRDNEAFSNPQAATNMTMIAALQGGEVSNFAHNAGTILIFVGDELAGIAQPQEVDGEILYFLTIQSNLAGEPLTFQTEDGTLLYPEAGEIKNEADLHYGSLKAPVRLTIGTRSSSPAENGVQKILHNGTIYILHDGEIHTVLGTKVNEMQ